MKNVLIGLLAVTLVVLLFVPFTSRLDAMPPVSAKMIESSPPPSYAMDRMAGSEPAAAQYSRAPVASAPEEAPEIIIMNPAPAPVAVPTTQSPLPAVPDRAPMVIQPPAFDQEHIVGLNIK